MSMIHFRNPWGYIGLSKRDDEQDLGDGEFIIPIEKVVADCQWISYMIL